MSTDAASITSLHCEIALMSERTAPAVADYPFFPLGLANDGNRVIERFFGTVSKGSGFGLGV